MKTMSSGKTGSALVASLFFVSVLLGLLLLLVGLTRLRSDTGRLDRTIRLSQRSIQTGLALALAEIEDSYLVPDNRVYSLPAQEAGWVSSGSGVVASGLVEETTAEWLGWPDRLRGTGPDSLAARALTAEWEVLGDPNEIHTAVAWVAVDLTGLLDPNLDSRIADTLELNFFPDANRYFFTAREVALVQEGADTLTPFFVPGSEVLDEGWFDPDINEWNDSITLNGRTIGMNPDDWEEEDIREVMAELFSDTQADDRTRTFLDFWNGRDLPSDEGRGLTAVAVPMINELAVTYVLTNQGVTDNQISLNLEVQMEVEVWYPFPGNPPVFPENQYRLVLEDNVASLSALEGTLNFQLNDQQDPPAFTCPHNPDGVDAFHLITLTSSPISMQVPETEDRISMTLNFASMELERVDENGVDGNTVDVVPEGLEITLEDIEIPTPGEENIITNSREAVDPRLNHDPDIWKPSMGSPGAVNLEAMAYKEPDDGDDFLDGFACWVPPAPDDGGSEISPASRIGFFPIGAPWRTFDLFGEEGRWWMKHTRPGTFPPSPEVGLVNPNSRYMEVLASVFRNRQAESWPGFPVGTPVSQQQAESIGLDLEAGKYSSPSVENGGYFHRGDWNWALESALLDITTDQNSGEKNRHAAESLLVETLPSFNARSQMWGVIVLAETRGPAGQTIASSRKLYRISRDPFENPDGRRKGRVLFVSDLPDPASGL